MKKISFLIVISLVVNILFANQKVNALGLFYTNVDYPITATGASNGQSPSSLKKGTGQSMNILGLVETGDAGIREAASNGGVKKIHFIDVNEKSVFFFFRKITTTVYGE
jgi:hypothetical protein